MNIIRCLKNKKCENEPSGHVHGERTEHARQPDGAQDSSISPNFSDTGSLRKTTRLQGRQGTCPLCAARLRCWRYPSTNGTVSRMRKRWWTSWKRSIWTIAHLKRRLLVRRAATWFCFGLPGGFSPGLHPEDNGRVWWASPIKLYPALSSGQGLSDGLDFFVLN